MGNVEMFVDSVGADLIISKYVFEDSEEFMAWNNLSVPQKEILLRRATARVSRLMFVGVGASLSSLPFPRYINGRLIDTPEDIKIATVLQCILEHTDSKKEYTKLKYMGIKSYSVEGANVTFQDNKATLNNMGIYKSVYEDYLRKWCY